MPAWNVAAIDSLPELAERLELSLEQLQWLADVRGLERSVNSERLRNDRYRLLPRASGVPRVLEIPKGRLKEVQRWVLREILNQIPTHPAAHGFVRGSSVRTHAEVHSGQAMVLGLDLKDFFASVRRAQVKAIFRAAGFETEVARTLAGLCTNTTPRHVGASRLLATPHLPQGAPSSPALANLAAFALDRRLSGLAYAHDLLYSRYADDLTFSGPMPGRGRRRFLVALATEIARDEGFAINERKTAMHPAGGRQQVCGVVVNARPNVPRRDYDRLKATLHNLAAAGPVDRSEAAALAGRIAWVASLNPARGAKLREKYAKIEWSE
ncbi:MAG: RNA-directed DNA polymerase [Solirubrobacterales bacterium]|nr:RNA-directed DNA polymerase [Solirubrobacterales bacterium]